MKLKRIIGLKNVPKKNRCNAGIIQTTNLKIGMIIRRVVHKTILPRHPYFFHPFSTGHHTGSAIQP